MSPTILYTSFIKLAISSSLQYLINFSNAQSVANYIYNYYQRRLLETFTMINDLEKLGENVKIDLELNQTKKGIITRMETDLTGGFLSETTVINEV